MSSQVDATTEVPATHSVDTDNRFFESLPVSFSDTTQRTEQMGSISAYTVQLITETFDEELPTAAKVFLHDWLKTQATFPDYSWRNSLLIHSQYPSATHIRTPDRWNNAGASINSGETAIWIWEPITGKACPKCGNTVKYHEIGGVDCQNHLTGSPEYWPEGVVGTRPTAYFDQSQVRSFNRLPTKYSLDLSSLSASVLEQLVTEIVDDDGYELSTVRPYEAEFDGDGQISRDIMTFNPTITVRDDRPEIKTGRLIKYHLLSSHYDDKGRPTTRQHVCIECAASAIAMFLGVNPANSHPQFTNLGSTTTETEESLNQISDLVESYLRRLRNVAHRRKERLDS